MVGRRLRTSSDSGHSNTALAAKPMSAYRAAGYCLVNAAMSSRMPAIRGSPVPPLT